MAKEPRDSQSIGNRVSLTSNGPYSLTYGKAPGTVSDGSNWFGPLSPLRPIAPLGVRGRRFDYTSGYNLSSRARQGELITFDQLRSFADSYDLLRLLIETRKDQMSRMTWNIVPKDKGLQKKDAQISEDVKSRIKRITEFFERPDREHFWDEWLNMLLEDLFVIDAPTLYRRKTRGGELYALQQIDGATIKRVLDSFGNTPEHPDPAYQQILKGYPAVDYTEKELIYRPRVRRVHKPYGFSPVEQIVMTVNIGMRRQIWQLQSLTEGNIPEALIGTPDSWTPDQVSQFQDWFDGMLTGDTAERRRARFVPGDVAKSYVPTKPDELFGAAEEWLIRVMCFAFSVSPQPFVKMMNRATAETAQEAAVSEGLVPIQNWVRYLVNTVIIDDFGSSDLEFKWLEEDELDPNIKSQIIDREHASGRLTYNETRIEQGKDPVDHPDADRPMFRAADGWKPIFLTPEEQARNDAMAEALVNPKGEPPGKAPEKGSEGEDGQQAQTGPSTRSETPPDDKEVAKKSDAPFPVHDCGLEKAGRGSYSSQPREPKGTPKGGQFKSTGSGKLTAEQAAEMGVAEVFVGKITPEEVKELRDAIANKEPQRVILDKMAPIYQSIPSAGEPSLVLDKSGRPPARFFEDRKYDVGGKETGIDGALDHLTRDAVGFAGKDGVALDRTATILLGPSAAGKSTFAEHIAKKSRSAIVDPDEAKKIIRGYNGGLGANEVHEESSLMSRMVEKRLTRAGANVVIPTVGGNADGINKRIDRLHRAGYKVHVVDVHVDKHEATRRMASRALRTGRPIGRDYVIHVGDKPSRTYEQVKTRANGYARIHANGPLGSDRITEASGVQLFATGQPVLGKSGGSGGELRGLAGRGGVPGAIRPEEGLSGGTSDLQKVTDQPREPKGSPKGGQFASTGSQALSVFSDPNNIDKMSLEDNRSLARSLSEEYKTNSDYRDAADVLSAYGANNRDSLVVRDSISASMEGKSFDDLSGDSRFMSKLSESDLSADDVKVLMEKSSGYYSTVRSAPDFEKPLYRGCQSSGLKGDQFELRGPTAFSSSLDSAMTYSGGTLIKVEPGAKALPLRALEMSRSSDEHSTVPAFYSRSDHSIHPKGVSHGYAINIDTDREMVSSGRYEVVSRERVSVRFEHTVSGQVKSKSVNVITVRQIGVF